MSISIIPQPQKIRMGAGWHTVPARGVIGIKDHALYALARRAAEIFRGYATNISHQGLKDTVSLGFAEGLKPEGYTLEITRRGVQIEGGAIAGVFYGLQTLRQIAEQSPAGRLPLLMIDDHPDFQDRGVCLDISKDRVESGMTENIYPPRNGGITPNSLCFFHHAFYMALLPIE